MEAPSVTPSAGGDPNFFTTVSDSRRSATIDQLINNINNGQPIVQSSVEACSQQERRLLGPCVECGDKPALCLKFNSPLGCSTSTDVRGTCMVNGSCAVECFGMNSDTPANAVKIFIRGGKYQSESERWSEAHDPDWPQKIKQHKESRVDAPGVSNDKLDFLGPLVVPVQVNRVSVIGHESESSVKGYVANVTLDNNITLPPQVEKVTLASLNIGKQLEQSLTKYMTTNVTELGIYNNMMTKLPADFSNLTSLAYLDAHQNNITDVPASVTGYGLRTLDLSENNLQTFEGTFPVLTKLNLSSNSLTAVPSVVFTMTKLEKLDIRFNLFENATLTQFEFGFLSKIATLSVSGPFNSSCASPQTLVDTTTNQSVSVCIEEHKPTTQNNDTRASHENEITTPNASTGGSKSHIGTTVGIVSGVLLVVGLIAFAVNWRRRRSSRSKAANLELSPVYFEAPPTDPTTNSSDLHDVISSPDMLRQYRVDTDDIQDLRRLGSGAFGVVWLVLYRHEQNLASKRLKNADTTQAQYSKFLDEIRLTARLDHTNIVQFIGVAWTCQRDLQALFEFMESGDLRSWLKREDPKTGWTTRKLQIAIDVVQALAYVHSFAPAIVHRDLKSSNVLLSENLTAKLCDFGVAREQSAQQTMTAGIGTSFWLAPEVITGRGDYGWRADIYSLGVLLTELDTHNIPYQDVRNEMGYNVLDLAILHKVGSGVLAPSFRAECPPEIMKLGRWCLEFDPASRPTAMDAVCSLIAIRSDWEQRERKNGEVN